MEKIEGRLIERGAELGRLDQDVGRVVEGHGVCVVIEGPAGIGKSRLLQSAREIACDAGLNPLSARGGELERDFAYGVVRQLFERPVLGLSDARRREALSGAAELAGPALGLGGAAEDPGAGGDSAFAVMHGLYWLTSNLAAQQPLLLEVDDVHWADAPTLRFLLFLLARLEGLPVMMLLASRAHEPGANQELVAKLSADPAATVLCPGPLSIEGVRELISERLAGDPAVEFADACRTSSGGNPFYLGELLTALTATGIEPTAAAAEDVRGSGPETISRSLLLRIGRLPPASTALARAVAVLGSEAEFLHAAALAEIEPEPAGEAADALAAVNILSTERPLRFVHPVVREAIYGDTPASQRTEMHARAARILREAKAAANQIAPHLLATDPAGDAGVVAALRSAAQEAVDQGAADVAQRYLRRALVEPPGDDLLARVLEELGTAEGLAGEDPAAAIEHLETSLKMTTEPQDRARVTLLHARTLAAMGDIPGAVSSLDSELERGDDLDFETALRLEVELASYGLQHPPTHALARERIQRFADVEGKSAAEQLAIGILSAVKWVDGNAPEAVALAERSLGDGTLAATAGSDSITVSQIAWVLVMTDRYDLAMKVLGETLADARRRGSTFGFTLTCGMRSLVAWRRGDLRASEAEARNAIDVGLISPFAHPAIHSFLTMALIARGELEEAEKTMAESWVGPALPDLVPMNLAFYALGRLRLAQGRPEDALAEFMEAGRRDELLGVEYGPTPWRRAAAEASLILERREEAQRLAYEDFEVAQAWGIASSLGVAWHARGLVGDEPLESFAKAVEILAESPARLDHARALVDLGTAIRHDGRRADAREPLREGLEMARRCGATVLAERAHAELVAAGARPRRLMFSGLESLTASERRVCEMAATGQSNREVAQALFVTTKTVENHLSRAYRKLDISSREQLSEALAEIAVSS